MDAPVDWRELDAELAVADDTISVYVGRLGVPPTYIRAAERTHYAASTMKMAVLAALYRAAEAGAVDLDAPVPVENEFVSAQPGVPRFVCARSQDDDGAVWARLGGTAPLRWLADRMIVRSSNLATNLVLSRIGLPAVTEAWTRAGARHSVTARGIEDLAARNAGLDNRVTATDLAILLAAIALGARGADGRIAGTATCAAMLDVLLRQEHREDLAAGLPPGVRIAHKNGWVRGVRHSAGVVLPDDADPYTVVVCISAGRSGDGVSGGWDAVARARIARISALAWAAR